MADESDDLMRMFDAALRGMSAQQAVDTILDVVGTTGGKATVETLAKPKDSTYVNRAGYLKPIKSAPKQYKLGAGPTGHARLQRRVNSLLLAASRLAKKSQDSDEVLFAERLVSALMTFNNPPEVECRNCGVLTASSVACLGCGRMP